MNENTFINADSLGRIPVFPLRQAVDAVNRGGRSPLERDYRLF